MRRLLLGLTCLASLSTAAWAQKAVTVKSGDLSLRLDTRVTIDGAMYIPGTNTDGWKWGDEDFRFSNGANVTQARFGVWGSLGEKWTGKIDVKVVDRQITLQDIFLDYKINPKSLYIRTGYYVDPVSVEVNAASSFLSLNTPTALSMFAHQTRFMTLSLTSYGQHHYLVGGLYGSSLGGSRSKANRGSDGWGVTVKGAYIPINEVDNTLYIGAYARYRTPDVSLTGTRDVMTFGTHPGSTIDGRNFTGGALGSVRGYALFGGELAITRGKFHLMGEYIANNVYFKDESAYQRKSAFFHGAYVTGSYMLIGRQRKYLNYWGIFSPLANIPSTGGLELIGRLSYVNANSEGKGSETPIRMGESAVATLGVNWYPTGGNLLIGVNYNYTMQDKYSRAGGKLVAPTDQEQKGFNFHTLQCRLQYVF